MRVIQFGEYGSADVLRLSESPTPYPAKDQIRIRIRAAAVNPADGKWRSGMFKGGADVPMPHVLGYDIAGEVDELGNGVQSFAPGDRVFAKLNPFTKGGYAEFAVLPASDVVAIPTGMDFATAAAIPTAGLTGVQMAEIHADVRRGDVVLVTGAVGAVGRFAAYAAIRRGATLVAAVRAAQVDEARTLGADHVAVLGEGDWTGPAFDVVLDTVGGAAVSALCRHLAPGGRIFTAATTPIPTEGGSADPAFVSIQDDPVRLAELAQEVATGKVTVRIADRLPLAAAAEAHRRVEAGGTGGKIILEP